LLIRTKNVFDQALLRWQRQTFVFYLEPVVGNRVTRWAFFKYRPIWIPTHFLSKLMLNHYHVKMQHKKLGRSCNSQRNCPKQQSHNSRQNSPNQVTLVENLNMAHLWS
jgi:hypothetical protein